MLTQIDASKKDASTAICTCEAQANLVADLAGCIRYRFAYSPFGGNTWLGTGEAPPTVSCITGILSATSVGDAAVLCQKNAAVALADCAKTAGCDATQDSICDSNYRRERAVCPRPTYDLDATVELNCFGQTLPAPMVCNDGTRIRRDYVCDGRSDCPQGEDELSTYCHP